MQHERIDLPNRYGDDVHLEHVKEGIYKLVFEDDYVRLGYEDDDTIAFIDPSGGPFISVGGYIGDLYIERIENIDNDWLIHCKTTYTS